MNNSKKYLQGLMAFFILFCTSCTDNFDEINSDPNKITEATASMIVTQLMDFVKSGDVRDYFGEQLLLMKYMSWIENRKDAQYNVIGEYGFNYYVTLSNVNKMLGYATEASSDTYTGFGLFLKANHLFQVSAYVGDIPYSEALQGEKGLLKPKYDTQKEVMRQIIADLDAAYDHFNKTTVPLAGDFSDLAGNPDKWKRIVNLLELRVLINLSKRADDNADLNIKAKFAEVAARPLLQSNADNLKLTFAGTNANMFSPWKQGNAFYGNVNWPSNFLIDMLKKYGDYRLFYYADPALNQIQGGKTADDWNAYIGADPTDDYGVISSSTAGGDVCALNLARYTDVVGEPLTKYGYAQQCFILAEGALRGWLPGKTADEYYLEGIKAGLQYTADATVAIGNTANMNHGRVINAAYIATQLSNPAIQLTGSFEQKLETIMEQKYIASFQQHIGDPYLDYRRTGYPRIKINPATNGNENHPNSMPMRYRYPGGERSSNLDNLQEAISRQYSDDNVNEIMWILK